VFHPQITQMVRPISIAFVLLLALASVVRAQTPVAACATLDIDGPTEVDPGTEVVFKAKLTGTIHTTKPEFKWTVSAGTITEGQGTDEISVDSTGLGGVEITATVELSGAPPGCKGSSRTTQVKVPPMVCGIAFDEYGDISFEDEKARLDNFAIQLMNFPDSSGIILMTAGQVTFKNESFERLARAKSYLAKVRSIDRARIVTLDCGFTQELNIIMWTIQPGIIPPSCDIFTTIPVSDVKFTKRRPKSSKSRR
jgi:hypothetical protein